MKTPPRTDAASPASAHRPPLRPVAAAVLVGLAIGGAQVGALVARSVSGAFRPADGLALRGALGALALIMVALGLRRELRGRSDQAMLRTSALPPRAPLTLGLALGAGATASWLWHLILQAVRPDEPTAPALLPSPALVAAMTLAVPFAEELFFRGTLLPALTPRGVAHTTRAQGGLSVVSTAILFGAYHLAPGPALHAALLGLALGWLALRGRSFWSAAAFHAAYNAASLALAATAVVTTSPFALDAGYAASCLVATTALVACLAGFARLATRQSDHLA